MKCYLCQINNTVKLKEILKLIISMVLLCNTMWCAAFPLNQNIASQNLNNNKPKHELVSPTTTFKNSLLISNPVSIPAASITNLIGGPFGNGYSSKNYHTAFLSATHSDILFLNYYINQTTKCVMQPLPLHLAFCVFRI